MKQKLSIVKIGGNLIEDNAELAALLELFAGLEGAKILVHGGGKLASEMEKDLGLTPQLIGGRRVTNAESLKVIVMVYGGLVNKNIVSLLQAKGCNAIGMSGADCNSIQAHKRPVAEIDFGYVGDVDRVEGEAISKLIASGFTPVFCALSHDGKGQLLNTNADTIAAELAIALSSEFETTLYYCFEKNGVLSDIGDEDSVIRHIDSNTYETLIREKKIGDGMLPKLENCFHALRSDVSKICIGRPAMLDPNSTNFTSISL